MTKGTFLRYPPTATRLGLTVLRVRLSLRETQVQFARRFRVSPTTVWKWETGRVEHMQKIYKELLTGFEKELVASGRLLPEQFVEVLFKRDVELANGVGTAR